MVGAVLVDGLDLIGEGWHRKAGGPHAEVEAIANARSRGARTEGATLFVTLEPCCTQGRTPPCTDAILQAGIRRVVVGAVDPNPLHAGRGLALLRNQGVDVVSGVREAEADELNEAFGHWIVHRTPWVTVKSAMTLDGRIADSSGGSKWITGETARRQGMRLRRGADAILVGVNTVLADDPQLTVRNGSARLARARQPRRFVLDTQARTPLTARLLSDEAAGETTIVVGEQAPIERVRMLESRCQVWRNPVCAERIDLVALMRRMGEESIVSLLVEGGGEVVASFLGAGLAHRVAFFYAPRVLASSGARPGVGGAGATGPESVRSLVGLRWRRLGEDLFVSARVEKNHVYWNC